MKHCIARQTFILLGLLSFLNTRAQFMEVSSDLGIDHKYEDLFMISSGVAIFNMNNDSLPDLYMTGGVQPDRIYLNNGAGFDRLVSYLEPEDFDYYQHNSTGIAAGDLNNDGYEDLLICGMDGYQNLLLMNLGNNKFDVIPSEDSGISSSKWATGASFGDLNEDGLLDIFIHNYVDSNISYVNPIDSTIFFGHIGYTNDLYINQADMVFEESSAAYGLLREGNSLASTFTNFDLDDDTDLYVINDFGQYTEPNELYENAYPLPFLDDIGRVSNADIGLFGMGIAIGDYDGDLDLDYYITNIGRNVLLQNQGDKTFLDVTNEAGVQDSSISDGMAVGWGTGFMDYDNDGDLDLYIANGYIRSVREIYNPFENDNALYRNNGDGTFTDVRNAMNFNDPSAFRGAAYGDLNMDGMLDIVAIPTNKPFSPVIPGLREEAAIFYNITENENNWLQVDLVGDSSNASAYGALVYLYEKAGRIQLRESDGGSSHGSSNTSIMHFGLGRGGEADSMVIIWPLGLIQTIREPEVNKMHVVIEGQPTDITVSVSQQTFDQVNLYPNPALKTLRVEINYSEHVSYEITNPEGQLFLKGSLNKGMNQIDIQTLPAGTYMFSSGEKSGARNMKIFIKQ